LFEWGAEQLILVAVVPGLPVPTWRLEEELRFYYIRESLLWEGRGD